MQIRLAIAFPWHAFQLPIYKITYYPRPFPGYFYFPKHVNTETRDGPYRRVTPRATGGSNWQMGPPHARELDER